MGKIPHGDVKDKVKSKVLKLTLYIDLFRDLITHSLELFPDNHILALK